MVETPFRTYSWVCEDCGWDFGEAPLKDGDECDNCGGQPMCSECGDDLESCRCPRGQAS